MRRMNCFKFVLIRGPLFVFRGPLVLLVNPFYFLWTSFCFSWTPFAFLWTFFCVQVQPAVGHVIKASPSRSHREASF